MKIRSLFCLLFLGYLSALTPLSASGRAEGAIQKTWDYPEGIHTLIVDADEQDIVIKAGGPRLSGRFIGNSGDEARLVRDGDRLTITVRSDRGWFSGRHRKSRVEVTLPDGLDLDLASASGAVLVEVVTGSLRARSASGDIEASRGGKGADVDSTSGTVRLHGFRGEIRVSSLSGEVLLEDLKGTIVASSLSGEIMGRDLAPENNSRFSSVTGDVTLELTGTSVSYRIRAETVSGLLKVGGNRSEDILEIGKEGPSVSAKTVSGDVSIP